VEIDPLNLKYNSVVYFNMAVGKSPLWKITYFTLGLSKLKKNEEALSALNKCLNFDPEYAKAYVKRGEINETLENFEEALKDFQKANHIEPSKIIFIMIKINRCL
jgi:tetratricopeptide (TPR) repeat protein